LRNEWNLTESVDGSTVTFDFLQEAQRSKDAAIGKGVYRPPRDGQLPRVQKLGDGFRWGRNTGAVREGVRSMDVDAASANAPQRCPTTGFWIDGDGYEIYEKKMKPIHDVLNAPENLDIQRVPTPSRASGAETVAVRVVFKLPDGSKAALCEGGDLSDACACAGLDAPWHNTALASSARHRRRTFWPTNQRCSGTFSPIPP